MITRTEQYEDGHREVYHQAGTITVDGHVRKNEKYIWTHPEKEECSACDRGIIPDWVKKGTKP